MNQGETGKHDAEQKQKEVLAKEKWALLRISEYVLELKH